MKLFISNPGGGVGGSGSLTGGGVVATGGYTLTVPATGTAALLGTANVFTTLQTITQANANTGILASTGYSLTGSNATSMIDLAGTWNTSGTPTAFKLNITDTASNAASLLFDFQTSGTSRIKCDKTGAITVAANGGLFGAGDLVIRPGFGNATYYDAATHAFRTNLFGNIFTLTSTGGSFASACTLNWNSDVYLSRKAAATLQLGVDAAGVTNQMFTAANRITSDGVGANLTIAPGNGRGAAGGDLILSHWTTGGAGAVGTLTTSLTINENGITAAAKIIGSASTTTRATLNIPSGTAPSSPVDGDVWSDGSDLKVRLGGATYTLTKA